MLSLLIASADPTAVENITRIAETVSVRVRAVSTTAAAFEWLELNHFDLLFVDARYPDTRGLELCQAAWKKNPFCLCALFDFTNPLQDEFAARVIGCTVFSGSKALDEITDFFRSIGSFRSASSEYGVLVVEDLDSPRDIIVRYVESLGFTNVEGAFSAEDALKKLLAQKNRYFSVITDLQMPVEDGVSLIKKIRSNEDLSPIPVIVLTAHATGEKLVESLAAGATGFLVKPPQKKKLKLELDKAKRIFLSRTSPRLCKPEDAHLIEIALGQ